MSAFIKWFRRQRRRLAFLSLVALFGLIGWVMSIAMPHPARATATSGLLAPAPKQQLGSYDYFGQVLSREAAASLVQRKGLDANDPQSYLKVGAVEITQNLLDVGEKIFFDRKLGDTFGLQKVLGFQLGFSRLLPELAVAIAQQQGKPTSNLVVTLTRDFTVGSQTFPKGTRLPTGLDLAKGSLVPIGLKLPGDLTCALCHVALSPEGKQLKGVPNGDLAIPLLVALAPNSAAGFARFSLNPLDPRFQGSGKTIIDSGGKSVKLPDPKIFERVFDDLVLAVPYGHFESSPDGIPNTTQIPPLFTFKAGPYTAGGEFAVGPFGGLSVVTNGVHSSEINLLAAAQRSAETIGIDREVYLGTVLQNAADRRVRLPNDRIVKPSEWLRQVAPDLATAELEDQVAAPGLGNYPDLKISLLTYNGLVFSPATNDQKDIAKGKFFFANNAMSAWQNSLVPPPNRSQANLAALQNGSVDRGAKVFESSCLSCHHAPYFTDNKIHSIAEIKTNPARAQSRLMQNALLLPPQMYSLDTPVPIPANAKVLNVPTEGISRQPNLLPDGLLPNGGYKTPSLLGLYLTAPYLHEGGVAVRKGALAVREDGSYQVSDVSGLGLSETLSRGILPDAASSLRALIDRDLRQKVVATNQANPALKVSNLDGTGHEFYIDGAKQQADLVNFLLALDDNPAEY
jgi:cytochrome c5